jgi:hypothetical protein
MLVPLNDARIKCFGGYLPIARYRCFDEQRSIWVGDRIVEPGTPADALEIIYFSRKYEPEKSQIDALMCEYEITDETIVGLPFLLVPKEKVLFGYDPAPKLIKRPPVQLAKGRDIQL